jgi:hypothetical protein
MARVVADWPTIRIPADARREWPAADCSLIHHVHSLLFAVFGNTAGEGAVGVPLIYGAVAWGGLLE